MRTAMKVGAEVEASLHVWRGWVRARRYLFAPVLVVSTVVGPAALGASGSPTSRTVGLRMDMAARASIQKRQLASATLAPGDTVERTIDLPARSARHLALSLTVVSVDGHSSLLNTDPRNGLQLEVDQCARSRAGWVRRESRLTCGDGHIVVLGKLPVAIAQRAPLRLMNVVPESAVHLRVRLLFPSTAGDRFEDAASSLEFRFTATEGAQKH
jgi:hypothetical protein